MIYTSLEQLAKKVLEHKVTKKVAVVAANDEHTLEAVLQAGKDSIATGIFVGDAAGIREKLVQFGEKPENYEIIHADSEEECALKAALAVKDGRADFLMKGLIPTNKLLKTLFSDQAGFKDGHIMSHLSIVQIPNYHKLLGVTDAAINITPDLDHKRYMIENAVKAMTSIGFDTPKVAVLASAETVNPKMPETVDAAALKKMNQDGLLTGCLVEGPLSYDLAMSKHSAEIKGMDSPVCGDVDLLVAPNIAAANILLKCLRYSAGAGSAGIVLGGKAPLVLTSRAVEPQDKYWPLVLAASAAK